MRAFVALTPPSDVVEDLADFVAPRRAADPTLRWTAPEQWHVTLAFLPDVAERHLDDLAERLGRAAARRTAFALALRGGGAFPDVGRGRVLFAGLDVGDRQELDRLATGVRAAAAKAGAAPDGGRFHPHLTLARSGRPQDLTRWLRVLDSYAGPRWSAAEVELVESRLGQGPGGRPHHEVLATFPLTAPHL
ncbi:RNA 2',3'-cyclic phosphodiesterase [Angustibacter peucedani]